MSRLDLVPFRRLLDVVVEPMRAWCRRLAPPMAVPLVVGGALLAVAQARWLDTLSTGGIDNDIFQALLLMMVAIALVLVAYFIGFSALFIASLDALAGRGVDLWRAWREAFRPRVLGTLIVVGVASWLSVMMCLVPALFVVPLLVYTLPVMVEEGRYGAEAIRRSIELARFNPTGKARDSSFLQTLALLLVGYAVSLALTAVVQLPFVVAQQVVVLRDAAAGQVASPGELAGTVLWLQLPAQVLGGIATAIAWLYWSFGIALLYREIRRRKEAADLEAAIEGLPQAAGVGVE